MTLEHHAGPVEQGAFVRLASKGDTIYQVLSLDADADRCWLPPLAALPARITSVLRSPPSTQDCGADAGLTTRQPSHP